MTISRSARQDICSHLDVDEDRIRIVYPGCSPWFRPWDPESARERVSRYGVDTRFLFDVGGTDFRKNLATLVAGFARIREGGYRGALVLAGETFQSPLPEILLK